MPGCVVKICKNNTTKNKKDTGITWHQFPADPVMLHRWTAKLRLSRQESWWKPRKRSVICSVHFNESDFYTTKGGLKRLCKGAVPQNALFVSSTPSENTSNKSVVTADPSTTVLLVNSKNSVVNADPSTTVFLVNSNNSLVNADPSTSVPIANSNNSAVAVYYPSTSVSIVNSNKNVANADPSTSVSAVGNETPPLDNCPDIDCIFDSPETSKLKIQLRRKTVLQQKHARIIKTLRVKNSRLKKRNRNLKSIIKYLKQTRFDNKIIL